VEYVGEEVGVWWRGLALAPSWHCRRSTVVFRAYMSEEDGTVSWAHPKSSRLLSSFFMNVFELFPSISMYGMFTSKVKKAWAEDSIAQGIP
jgi:hypothetical protein